MNVLVQIAHILGKIFNWFHHFWTNLGNVLLQFAALYFKEKLVAGWYILGKIPVPDALAHFTWPDVGPLGPILVACGVPEAFAILSAAGTLKLAMSVLRLI